eukprot:3603161-Prymnesium_polylepis.4
MASAPGTERFGTLSAAYMLLCVLAGGQPTVPTPSSVQSSAEQGAREHARKHYPGREHFGNCHHATAATDCGNAPRANLVHAE